MRYLVPFVVGVILASTTLPIAAKPEPPQPTATLTKPGLAPAPQAVGADFDGSGNVP